MLNLQPDPNERIPDNFRHPSFVTAKDRRIYFDRILKLRTRPIEISEAAGLVNYQILWGQYAFFKGGFKDEVIINSGTNGLLMKWLNNAEKELMQKLPLVFGPCLEVSLARATIKLMIAQLDSPVFAKRVMATGVLKTIGYLGMDLLTDITKKGTQEQKDRATVIIDFINSKAKTSRRDLAFSRLVDYWLDTKGKKRTREILQYLTETYFHEEIKNLARRYLLFKWYEGALPSIIP